MRSAAQGSASRGSGPSTGRSGRLRPPSRLCAAMLKAVLVDPPHGAAAGAGLHERAVLLAPVAQPARPLLRIRSGALALRHEVPRAPPRWGLRLVVLEPAFASTAEHHAARYLVNVGLCYVTGSTLPFLAFSHTQLSPTVLSSCTVLRSRGPASAQHDPESIQHDLEQEAQPRQVADAHLVS